MTTKKGTLSYLSDSNLKTIMEIIWTNENVTRQDLVEKSGLSPAGISKMVATLIDKGLIVEDQLVSRKKGRRAISLRLNDNSFFAIGVRFARSYVKVGLFNLSGKLILTETRQIKAFSVEQTLSTIKECIRKILNENTPHSDIVGIGISAPGPLFSNEGKVALISNSPGWRNISLAEQIESEFGIPTLVEHDANVSVLAEHWFGKGKNVDSLVYVLAEQGIGAGIYYHGTLFRGNQNIAGEIGHATIDFNGPKCECGNRGCLEMYCSSLAMVKRARQIWGSDWPESRDITSEAIMSLAKDGDKRALELLQEMGSFMGMGIVNLINSFNPEMIIIGDELSKAGDPWLASIRAVVKERVIPEIFESTVIELSELPIEPAFLGTGTMVIKNALGNISQL